MEKERIKRCTEWNRKACDICGEIENITPLGVRTFQVATQHSVYEIIMEDVVCEKCGFVFAHRVPKDVFL